MILISRFICHIFQPHGLNKRRPEDISYRSNKRPREDIFIHEDRRAHHSHHKEPIYVCYEEDAAHRPPNNYYKIHHQSQAIFRDVGADSDHEIRRYNKATHEFFQGQQKINHRYNKKHREFPYKNNKNGKSPNKKNQFRTHSKPIKKRSKNRRPSFHKKHATTLRNAGNTCKTIFPETFLSVSEDTSDVSRHSTAEENGHISIIEISDSDKEKMDDDRTKEDDIPTPPETSAQTSADKNSKIEQNARILQECGISIDHPQYSDLLQLDFSKCTDKDDCQFMISIAPKLLFHDNKVYTLPPNINRRKAKEIFLGALRRYNSARDVINGCAKEWDSTIDVHLRVADHHDKIKDNIHHPMTEIVTNSIMQLDSNTRLLASQTFFAVSELDILAEQLEHLSLWMTANKDQQFRIVPKHAQFITERLTEWKNSREDFIPPDSTFHAPSYTKKLQEQLVTYIELLKDDRITVNPEFETNRFSLHTTAESTKQQFYALMKQRNRPETMYMPAENIAPVQQNEQQYYPEQHHRFSPDDVLHLDDQQTYNELQRAAAEDPTNLDSLDFQDISDISNRNIFEQQIDAGMPDINQQYGSRPIQSKQPNHDFLQWFIDNNDEDIKEDVINKIFRHPENCSLCEQDENKTSKTQTDSNAPAEGQPILLLVSNQRNIKIIEPHIKENMTQKKIHLNNVPDRTRPIIYFSRTSEDNIANSASYMMSIVQTLLTTGKPVNVWLQNYGKYQQEKMLNFNPMAQLAEQEEIWQYMDQQFDRMDINMMKASMMLAVRLSLQLSSLCMAKKPMLLHPDAKTVCSVRAIWPHILNPAVWNVSRKNKAKKLRKINV